MLKEILGVEAEIEQIKRNPKYMKITQYLKRFNGVGFGNPLMTIPSLDDLNRNLKVRRHSKEMNEIICRFEEWHLEYEKKIKDLCSRRNDLEKQLFGQQKTLKH